MGAALAMAIMLVVAVGGLSVAMQTQRPLQQPGARPHGPLRPPRVQPAAAKAPRPPREKRPTPVPTPPPPVPEAKLPTPTVDGPELLRSGERGEATVISVVDERTLGPVTRSRLTLRVVPVEGDAFEVQTRVAFPTPEARSRVRVGGTIAVRYDAKHHHRVIVELSEE